MCHHQIDIAPKINQILYCKNYKEKVLNLGLGWEWYVACANNHAMMVMTHTRV